MELQRELVLGVVSGPTSKPRFRLKPIARVFDLPPLPAHLLKLANWLIGYYPAPLGNITQQLLPASFSDKLLAKPPDLQLVPPALGGLPPLTDEQQLALKAMAERNSYLLHGITGSGKTRLYIELAARTINSGKSALVLTPEISLTSQLAGSFRQVFGERVLVMHSGQTPVKRQKAWLDSLQAGGPVIVIGPRSALFSPLSKLDLIILDEAHESAYKQEQAPHYQTGRVAAYLSQITRSTLVLGSATPSVSDYYLAEQKKRPIINLTQLASGQSQPERKSQSKSKTAKAAKPVKKAVVIVDRKDHGLFNRSPHLSQPLLEAVGSALGRGEQSLLYLNRRGTARLVLCENCGWQATCPHCDIPLTYHGDYHQLRCHGCSYHAKTPGSCPDCGHQGVIFKTAGTKAIVDDAQRLFPGARIARFDTDNLKAERFEQHFERIKKGEVDILVGTQLLAKGLDLPKLSTLGVLLADTSLYLPDFSAAERTFQLISQVLGRIGRGHVAGRAVIQTYHPEHPVLADALKGDYQHFYQGELAERRQFLFPPFCYLLKLTVRRATIKTAQAAADKLKTDIETVGHQVRVEGPAPSFYERFQNKYQWQLVVKAKNRPELLKIIADLPSGWSYDLDPLDLL